MSTTAQKPAGSAAAQSPGRSTDPTPTPQPKAEKVPALKLTLGGAPETWHIVEGGGYVHPRVPSPVAGPGEPSLAAAEKLSADPGCAVTLVRITSAQAEQARKTRAAARSAGIAAARETRRAGKSAPASEAEKFRNEVAAAAGKE